MNIQQSCNVQKNHGINGPTVGQTVHGFNSTPLDWIMGISNPGVRFA